MEDKAYRRIQELGYAVILIVASLPLACEYIIEGGDILLWISRIEELVGQLQNRQLMLYPSIELINQENGQYTALNTNVWLLIPAAIRIAGGSVVLAYRLYMLLMNLLAVITARKLFEALFKHPIVSMIGTLLFLTCPYRIYIYYDKVDLGKAMVWAIIPLVFWCVFQLGEKNIKWKRTVIATVALAGIGYADGILFLIICSVYLLGVIWYKRIMGIVEMICSMIVCLPGIYPLLQYLLLGGMENWNLPLGSIAAEGYAIGQFFSSWAYKAGHPGLGLGVLAGLLTALWLYVSAEHDTRKGQYGYFTVLGCLMMLLTLRMFPWDMVQRVAAPFLRAVALIQTPGIFFGVLSLICCVWSCWGLERMLEHREPTLKLGAPCVIIFAALGNAIYLCNTLTYYRMPVWEYFPG